MAESKNQQETLTLSFDEWLTNHWAVIDASPVKLDTQSKVFRAEPTWKVKPPLDRTFRLFNKEYKINVEFKLPDLTKNYTQHKCEPSGTTITIARTELCPDDHYIVSVEIPTTQCQQDLWSRQQQDPAGDGDEQQEEQF